MNAAVIAVGSELLQPGRRDTNGEWLVARLADHGIETSWSVSVEDDPSAIARLTAAAWAEVQLVILTGGLGPTDDDRTREALASALDLPLTRDDAMVRHIEGLFSARGRVPGPNQARQADRPQGAVWIDNALGSAPGILFEKDGRVLVALPGVPAEMKAMFEATMAGRLATGGATAMAHATLRIAGRPESYVDEMMSDLYKTPGTRTTILASAGTVELLLHARGRDASEARERLTALSAAMRARLGHDLYGDGDDTLASVVGRLLLAQGATVATGESCTGGLLGGALTDVPGSSAWYRGGIVCYANDLKGSLAGVDDDLIRAHGAVSEPVARALAAGAARVCSADFGLGITGVAGPAGGTAQKPVGTVYVALHDAMGGSSRTLDWPGDRALIRRRAVNVALDLLRRRLLT